MHMRNLIQIVFIVILITLTSANDGGSFSDQIKSFQDDAKSLCSHMEEVTLFDASYFQKLMQDAHESCPDYQRMESILSYMESTSEKHHSSVDKQLNAYHELLRVLTEGLKSGGMVVFYLKEGNYEFVRNILNEWHASFTKYRATFYPADIPIEIMIENRKTFFYGSWFSAITSFITKCLMYILPLIIATIWMNWDVIKATSPISASARSRFKSMKIICRLLILCVIIVHINLLFQPMRTNWHPNATSKLKEMEIDRTYLINKVLNQINSIEELQKHISMYEDVTVQANVNELVQNLITGFGQASKEVADAYKSGVTVLSTFRRTYGRIEEKAKNAGKLSEAKDLLLELNKTADSYEVIQRSLGIEMVRQQNVLPILKDQIKSIRTLVKEDRLVELGVIIGHHETSLHDISTSIDGVMYQLDDIILTVDKNKAYGMKSTIKSLIDECVSDETTAKFKIAKGVVTMIGGGGTGTYLGLIALKTGYILGSFTAAVAVPPLVAAIGVGAGIYYGTKGWYELQGASNYRKELEALEIERLAMKVSLEQLHKAIEAQQNAVVSSKTSMNNIAELSAHYTSKISGFTLKSEHKNAIRQDLDNLMKQYDNIEAVLSLFAKVINDQQHPQLPHN
ncbi:unnamed protein product [Adineta steineri]|uniref:Uncharacterized protein n=1 Tax=Adineta steineri TaxID=433720 RepID=A0A819Q4K8_9BILA|nr:unnamed protein product [Adineta steineri]CAF4020980.1 unnamed protein product [Adineta steineri]